MNDDLSDNFTGHDNRECGHHRATGHRAWCYDDGEWCSPGFPCRGCEIPVLRAEVARLTHERDLAIAHDRQPYPTADAYERACAALEAHRQRADKAEAANDRVRELVLGWIARKPEQANTSVVAMVLAEAGEQVLAALGQTTEEPT